ncbi:MAG TPA: hypothetical protein VFX92_05005 [Candidatus Krumholzibacteria bacterium]|nr:hypothetical protein [Candidatus Krumholzibacteria bacterium]
MRTVRTMRARHGREVLAVASFMTLALVLPACTEHGNNANDVPDVVTQSGDQLFDLQRDEARRTVEANVVHNGQTRRLTLAPLPDGPSPGIVAAIADDAADYFELSIARDERTGEVWLRERTPTDEMTITVREAGGRVYETYAINGNTLAFDHPALDVAQLDKAVARYRAGTIAYAATPELRETGEKLARFDAFYTPTMTNTLHRNPDGELLISVLTDPAVAGAITGESVAPQRYVTATERVCWLATMCVSFKARVGGLANPAFAACLGTLIACVFTEIVCWIANCG